MSKNVNLILSDSLMSEFSNNDENAVFLVPRMLPVSDSYYEKNNSNTGISVKNLELRGNFYTKKLTAFDSIAANSAKYEYVNVRGINTLDLITFPTAPNDESVGIRTGRGSNYGTSNHIIGCYCIYMGKGFSVCGEHYIIQDCLAHHCRYGFAFHDKPVPLKVEHPNMMIGCSIEHCFQFMLLTVEGVMNQSEYDALLGNKQKRTLICIGLSTEGSYHIPLDEEHGGEVAPTLGILEIIPGRYRGRIEGDNIFAETGSCIDFTFTSYQGY